MSSYDEFTTQGEMMATRLRLTTKATQTLLGICTGLVADGQLCDQEIHFLHTWMLENSEAGKQWPGSEIMRRINAILDDGMISEEERLDLLTTLQNLTGNEFIETGAAAPAAPAMPPGLPIDDSATVSFNGKVFCCTGKFIHGTRTNCHKDIIAVGGQVAESMTNDVDYLVIGALVSSEWMYQSFGRKIEKAALLREKRGKPAIITEQKWAEALRNEVSRRA